jgi:hypothetical protein
MASNRWVGLGGVDVGAVGVVVVLSDVDSLGSVRCADGD